MSYQVLARKWRPQDFATLIGQGPVVTALRNALQEGRIAQAYLFAGVRGVSVIVATHELSDTVEMNTSVLNAVLQSTKSIDQSIAKTQRAIMENLSGMERIAESKRGRLLPLQML